MYKLRELEKRDLPEINKWRNDPALISCLGAPFRFINLDVDMRWFESYMSNRNGCIRCAITTTESDDILGLVSLTNIDYIERNAVFHIMIGDSSNQGKGIGSFAVEAMLYHAFKNMNLHRVELTVLSTNKRAIHLYEKAGFIKEGTKRSANFKNGEYIDVYCYAILGNEFDKKISPGA